jgi:hypothetical protein
VTRPGPTLVAAGCACAQADVVLSVASASVMPNKRTRVDLGIQEILSLSGMAI